VEGKKMSKSLGNVVDPAEMAEKYGTDAFRYFLFREVPFGLDGDFSEEAFAKRINTDLANDIGNLLNRTLTMIEKYREGTVPGESAGKFRQELEGKVREWFDHDSDKALHKSIDACLGKLQFHQSLTALWEVIGVLNEYIASTVPWKERDEEVLSNILYTLAESLRILAIYVYPFMPDTAETIWKQIGLDLDIASINIEDAGKWGGMKPGTKVKKGDPLFPRIDLKKTLQKESTKQSVGAHRDAPSPKDNLISIHDFARIELKIGKVLEAERVDGSNKLIKLQVDTGEKRQIVAGIGKSYAPEDLDGKSIVVVTNLKPAKLMGVYDK
jgi:methionyl-tRNA synthetase